jgi:hypothetical protein
MVVEHQTMPPLSLSLSLSVSLSRSVLQALKEDTDIISVLDCKKSDPILACEVCKWWGVPH